MTPSPFRLDFTTRHLYETEEAIAVTIRLISSHSLSAGVLAHIDTGNTFCVFDRAYADILGLNLTDGIEERISTATGSFYCFGHELTVSVFDLNGKLLFTSPSRSHSTSTSLAESGSSIA